MGRPREHGEDTRAELLEAAGRLLAEEGPGALTVRRLADEVGTTTRAIYSLFGGKDGIVSAMYRQAADNIVELHLAVPRRDDPVEEFLPIALAYRENARTHPNLYRLLFERAVPGFVPSKEDYAYCLQALLRLHDAVQRSIEAGRFRDREAWPTTRELWALVHGLASLELQGYMGTEEEADGAWQEMVGVVIGGLASQPSATAPS
jgi:AcrR family transcriptional regulator